MSREQFANLCLILSNFLKFVEFDIDIFGFHRIYFCERGGNRMREILCAVLLCGIPVSLLWMLAAAALLTAVDLSFVYYSAAAAIPLLCGCILAGYRAGKRLRSGGLRCGLLTALLLSALWYAAVCILSRRLHSPALFLLSLPSGMFGGVCGVNIRLPMPERRLHTARRIPLQLALSQNAATEIRRVSRMKRRNAAKIRDEMDVGYAEY